jgi:hypothetical protein
MNESLGRPPKADHQFRRVAILFAGGPAPGANAVISTAATSFMREGTEVIATFPPQRVMDTLAPLANEAGPALPQPTLRRRRAAA